MVHAGPAQNKYTRTRLRRFYTEPDARARSYWPSSKQSGLKTLNQLADLFLGQIACPRQLVLFPLIGFNHQDYPQYEPEHRDKRDNHHVEQRYPTKDNTGDTKDTKHYDRLHSMEADKLVLFLYQNKYETTYPP